MLRRTALPKDLAQARPKRLRFCLFAVAATLIHHARRTVVRVIGALGELVVRLSAARRALWQQTPTWQATPLCPDTG